MRTLNGTNSQISYKDQLVAEHQREWSKRFQISNENVYKSQFRIPKKEFSDIEIIDSVLNETNRESKVPSNIQVIPETSILKPTTPAILSEAQGKLNYAEFVRIHSKNEQARKLKTQGNYPQMMRRIAVHQSTPYTSHQKSGVLTQTNEGPPGKTYIHLGLKQLYLERERKLK